MGARDPAEMGSTPRKGRAKSIGHYILLKTIGEGTFGKVKLGTHILTGERVAVKVLEKERIVDIADVERVAREIHILKLIRHPHIIQLYEIIETPRQLYLIMEYARRGELFDWIVVNQKATEREACRFLHQILAGVEKIHAMSVVHRDLKPENLLLDEQQDIKIVDFGLSNTYQDGQLLQTACGSPCYAAPEMIKGDSYVPGMVDIWSCGVILFALVSGYLPFEDPSHKKLYQKILAAEYEMPSFVSKEVSDLVAGMLTTDPTKRMTLVDIRQHVWYRQLPESSLQVDDFNEGQKDFDEGILEQLDSYGFARDYAVKCLQTNKHNQATTTYYLLKEKRWRKVSEGGGGGGENFAQFDLDLQGNEDLAGEINHMVQDAVATVATPARGSRNKAKLHAGGSSGATPPAAPGGHRRPAAAANIPPLNFGEMGEAATDFAGNAATTSPHPRAGSRSARGPGHATAGTQEPPQSGRGRSDYQQSYPSSYHPEEADMAPRFSGGWEDHRGAGYGFPPPPPRRRLSGIETGGRWHHASGGYGMSMWADPIDGTPYARDVQASPRWRHPSMDQPLTARGRVQGNSSVYRERSSPSSGVGRRGVVPPAAWGGGLGDLGDRGRAQPYSARGPRSSGEEQGLFYASRSSTLPPRQIMQEVLHTLTSHRINFRHVSTYLVRCQHQGVRLEIEVMQLERGASFAVRFSRASGDVGRYKELCNELLGDMHL
eukprot:gnl/TRDRNA2_/TRDRNA2_153553_c0_seq1.p1 gnl/TRDRNA2_/TRDRNA2_153553_c0~~gnl/TRDRNA2_/TRDRNA2_153553_c0_seq1.p1  ORF type:complete len:773 (+),score=126.57 gnl/TRDRNA2_/TRDRNA2_153553_c0_seq1:169-2319(+)